MNIHEYQAKQLFSEFGIPVLTGAVASSAAEAVRVARHRSMPVDAVLAILKIPKAIKVVCALLLHPM